MSGLLRGVASFLRDVGDLIRTASNVLALQVQAALDNYAAHLREEAVKETDRDR